MKIRSGICLSSAMALTLGLTAGAARADEATLQAQIRNLSAQLQALQAQVNAEAAAAAAAKTAAAAAAKTTAAAAQTTAAATPAEAPNGKSFITEGSFPGSFLIPSTNTSVRLGGYVKADVIYEPDAGNGGVTTQFGSIPLPGTAAAKRDGEVNVTARQTRLSVQTRTPTGDGETLRTYVEGDFYGQDGNKLSTNSTVLRLRQAYGVWNGLLIGQTYSNFEDHDAGIESVEFNNSIGRANGIRQAMVQYQHTLGPGLLSVALESPDGDFQGADQPALNSGANTISTNILDKAPDFTAAYIYRGAWGHVQVMGVARELSVDTGGIASANSTVPGGAKIKGRGDAFGGGGGASVLLNTNSTDGKDNYFTAEFSAGDGIGRYIQGVDSGRQAGYFDNATQTLHTEAAYGFAVAYRNWWSSTLRTNVIYGHTHASNFSAMDTSDLATNPNKDLDNVYVNLIWSPVPQTNFGLEYVLGHRVADGPSSTKAAVTGAAAGSTVKNEAWGNRLQFGAQYLF